MNSKYYLLIYYEQDHNPYYFLSSEGGGIQQNSRFKSRELVLEYVRTNLNDTDIIEDIPDPLLDIIKNKIGYTNSSLILRTSDLEKILKSIN